MQHSLTTAAYFMHLFSNQQSNTVLYLSYQMVTRFVTVDVVIFSFLNHSIGCTFILCGIQHIIIILATVLPKVQPKLL